MLIESEHTLEVGKSIQMEIFILGDEHLHLNGKVASCMDVGEKEQEIYDIGIEFVSISDNNNKKLEATIQLLQNM